MKKDLRYSEYIKSELQKLVDHDDTECAHARADELLCKLLVVLGHRDIIEVYNEIKKWYA